ncbi:MAG: tRNA pseudouridine(38-40) synthase TruA [Mycoplasmataceae bacterium]|nr:tRNA pseudouridine(38-40) synthase TruA [Mycoplasmataceae bacterium]
MENFNYRLTISYDGTLFFGWAKQPGLRTVQGIMEEKISTICNEKIHLNASGRTDKYVHALNQVLNFKTKKQFKPKELKKILNNIIDKDIYVKEVTIVDNDFHARFSALNKTYKYVINTKYDVFQRNYSLYLNYDIDIKKIKKLANFFLNEHDFSSFSTSSLKDNVRTINWIKIKKQKDLIIILINANGFLRSMVRMIVASLLHDDEEKIKTLLSNPGKGKSIEKVYGCGLYLLKVNYK